MTSNGGNTHQSLSMSDLGIKGGNTTLRKYGPDHYRRMGKLSAAKRAKLPPELQTFIDLLNNNNLNQGN